MLSGEGADLFRLLTDAVNEAEFVAFALNRRHQRLAPAPKPDNGGIDHAGNVGHSRKSGNG